MICIYSVNLRQIVTYFCMNELHKNRTYKFNSIIYLFIIYLWRSGCVLGSFVASNNGKNTLSNNCWKLSKILLDLNMSLKKYHKNKIQ